MRNKVPKRMLACLLALFMCFGSGVPRVAADGSEAQQNTNETSTDAEPGEYPVDDETLNDNGDLDETLSNDGILYESPVDDGVGYYETLEPDLLQGGSMATGTFANAPPAGSDLDEIFVKVGNTDIDSEYPNVAIITYDEPDQCGAIWAKKPLDLTKPFSTEMRLHLGHSDGGSGAVADGMTFTLQNDSEGIDALGGRGEGLGAYRGRDAASEFNGEYLRNSLVIEFDTYYNTIEYTQIPPIEEPIPMSCIEDPKDAVYSAHCTLVIPNSNIIEEADHQNVFFFNPSQEWVLFSVEWTPTDQGVTGGTLTYTFGDSATMTYIIDDVAEVFGGTEVYWGFTGSTGGITALQAAAITKLPTQEFSAVKAVADSTGQDINGEDAGVGDPLRYKITVTAHETIAGIGPVTVIDTLSSYVSYAGDATISLSTGGPPGVITPAISGSTLTFDTNHTLANAGDWLEITFDVVVLESGAGNKIINAATVNADKLTEPQTTNSTEVSIRKVSYKVVDNSSSSGVNGVPVQQGDTIVYKIFYVNNGNVASSLTITDILDDVLIYLSSTGGGVYDPIDRTVTWNVGSVPVDGTGYPLCYWSL